MLGELLERPKAKSYDRINATIPRWWTPIINEEAERNNLSKSNIMRIALENLITRLKNDNRENNG